MRPIRLQISAFGPFAGVEDIDFQKLGENPLFLINGPTGSGKSTILDAICFALYGETTGNERSPRQMRCDHAKPATLTQVTLDFQLASGQYRINRIPEQNKPKARGEGSVRHKASATLEKIVNGKSKLISATKITEATRKIINLIGLSAEQFRQVVVLPQGKFRDLLLAKSEDRETIFQQLFQTQVYSALQDELTNKANSLKRKLKKNESKQKARLEIYGVETHEQFQIQLSQLKKRLKVQKSEKHKADQLLKTTQAQLQEAQKLDMVFQEQAQAMEKDAQLKNQKTDIENQKMRLKLAKAAQDINHYYIDTMTQKARYQESRGQVQNCEDSYNTTDQAFQDAKTKVEEIPKMENELERFQVQARDFENYQQYNKQLQSVSTELDEIAKWVDDSDLALKEKTRRIESESKLKDDLEIRILSQSKTAQKLSEKQLKLSLIKEYKHAFETRREDQNRLDEITTTIRALQDDEEKAEQQYQEKAKAWADYEQAWKAGQAAILARDLKDDEPCPVCGSRHHPEVAKYVEDLPTEHDLNTVRQTSEIARSQLEDIVKKKLVCENNKANLLTRLKDRETKFQEILAGSSVSMDAALLDVISTDPDVVNPVSVESRIMLCGQEIMSLKQDLEAIPAQEAKLMTVKDQISALELVRNEALKTAENNRSALAVASANVKNLKDRLPLEHRQPEALEAAVLLNIAERDRLKIEIENARTQYQQTSENKIAAEAALHSARSNLDSANKQLNEAINIWDTALQKSELRNETAFIAAHIQEHDAAQLEKSIRQHEVETELVQRQLEEKKTLISDKSKPDLQQFAERNRLAEEAKAVIDDDFHKTQVRYDEMEKTKAALEKLLKKHARMASKYGVIGKLSDVSNGKNTHNLSLQRFVLSVLLDDVLIEASQRLFKMSSGRYQLYRKQEVSDRRSKAGLELVVDDSFSGELRPVETLSSGESFIAALALALGLSDVIQAYSGGVRLDTLFIDEGFGTLDPELLDLVISTLVDLKASGRMVGVISHVEELKSNIQLRLDIVSQRGISHTRIVGAQD